MSERIGSLILALVAAAACVCLGSCARQESPKEATALATQPTTVVLSPKAVDRFGISLTTVTTRQDIEEMRTTGEIKADDNLIFHVNSLSSGRIIADKAMLGDLIHSGQTLAIVQNLEVTKIYGEYIHQAHQNEIDVHLAQTRATLAKKNYDRLKRLYNEKIAAEKDLLKAEADKNIEEETLHGLQEHATHIKQEAQAMLSAYGVEITDAGSERIENNSPIIAPRGGVIMKKTVTVGDVVSNAEPLYVVGDLSHVWLDVVVYDTQLQNIKLGDPVTFTSDSLPGRSITGRISYIKTSTDENSKTFLARAVIPNPQFELKPGMLGEVSIHNSRPFSQPFVPEQALQHYGKEDFVFVAEPNDTYRKQLVEPGKKLAGGYLITQGLRAGQKIVDKGSFTLKAEMLKGSTAGED